MKYNFNIDIGTKEELNKYVSDEEIMEHYFGKYEINQFYISPRGEDDASFIIDYYEGELKWRDFGVDIKPRNSVEFVQYIYSLKDTPLSFYEALNTIYDNLKKDIPGPKKIIPKQCKSTRTAVRFRRNYYDWELQYWRPYGINLKTLQRFNVYPGEIWLNKRLWHRSKKNDPLYIYLWSKENEIYKGYRPKAPQQMIKGVLKRLKFFSNNIRNHVQGWDYLPETGDLVFITKSYKDVMVLYTLGIPAIAPHSEGMFIPEWMLEELRPRFKHIYVNYDSDKTGVEKSRQFTSEYKLKYWNVPKIYKKAKDPADFVKYYGAGKVIKNIHEKLTRDKITLY